ncbi:MAG: glycosyltransferase family 39 protein [Dehalococcoidales bacterium]|nr:glycosyltransferase family 39 protein [Dehalococcoidales bacterium]
MFRSLPSVRKVITLPPISLSGGVALLVLSQLLLGTLLLRLLWLDQPSGDLIFDEVYYVNAARVILGWPVPEGAPYADAAQGIDPNAEHLPLAKVMLAGSMQLFGDNAYGWRLPSVLLGTAAVGLLYLIVRRVTGRDGLALFAAFLFSLDNLVFIHSRIATLDIYMLAFMLGGVYLHVAGRPLLAGAVLALSALAKLTGIYALGALFAFEALRFLLRPEVREAWRGALGKGLMLGGGFLAIFIGLLWPLDHFWTRYQDPVDHLAYVLEYGAALKEKDYASGSASFPWQWLANEVPITYLRVSQEVKVDGQVVSSRRTVDFQGAMNPFVVAMLPLALAFLLERAARTRHDLPLLLLALLAATFLPSLAVAVFADRVSYIFYFLPVLPALCAGIAYLLLDNNFSRVLALGYAIGVVFGFLTLFPFKF